MTILIFSRSVIDLSTGSQEELTCKDKFFFSCKNFILKILYSVIRESDATIVSTSYAYESVSLDAMKQWLSEMQKELHVLGPLLPSGYGTEIQNGEEGVSVDIETFLEDMQVQYGKRSVFFVRFFPCFCMPTK